MEGIKALIISLRVDAILGKKLDMGNGEGMPDFSKNHIVAVVLMYKAVYLPLGGLDDNTC